MRSKLSIYYKIILFKIVNMKKQTWSNLIWVYKCLNKKSNIVIITKSFDINHKNLYAIPYFFCTIVILRQIIVILIINSPI